MKTHPLVAKAANKLGKLLTSVFDNIYQNFALFWTEFAISAFTL